MIRNALRRYVHVRKITDNQEQKKNALNNITQSVRERNTWAQVTGSEVSAKGKIILVTGI